MTGAVVSAARSRSGAALVAAQGGSIRRLRDPCDARLGKDRR